MTFDWFPQAFDSSVMIQGLKSLNAIMIGFGSLTNYVRSPRRGEPIRGDDYVCNTAG